MKLTNNFLLLPNSSLSVEKLLLDSGRSSEEAAQTIQATGISNIRYSSSKMLTEFTFDSLSALHQKHKETLKNIDAIIVVSQSYDQRSPSISTRIQRQLDLDASTFCIDIMDGCAGYIKALALASMLEKIGHHKVLVIAGDINSVMTSQAEIGTKVLFGDGLSVSILESDHHTLETRMFNNGDQQNCISCTIEKPLIMNGFEVFRFTQNVVPRLINTYIEETGKSLQSYDLVGLHQASKMVVSTICTAIKYKNTLGNDFACNDIGNLGAGSIGAWLSNISHLEGKGKKDMLAVGFGAGLSWGLASLTVQLERNEVIYV